MKPKYTCRAATHEQTTCDRPILLAEYILENGCTVRAAAAWFGISKSTVHKDITERLQRIDHALYSEVKLVLERNKAERHLRGGEATRVKYLMRSDARQTRTYDSDKLYDKRMT